MGAENWQCVVPYQADLTLALAEAQQIVFTRGDYRRPHGELDFLDEIGFYETEPQERESVLDTYGLGTLRPLIAQVGVDGLYRRLQELHEAPVLETLEDLRALNCIDSSGTASVLDMAGIADAPEPGFVAPVTPEELRQAYGTDKPTRAQMDASDGFYEDVGRGEGRYIVLYASGQPSEILFTGYSFD